jgi:hypothetical protein
MITSSNFDYLMTTQGWVTLPDQIPATQLQELRHAVDCAYQHCRHWQTKQGLTEKTTGSLHHLVGQAAALDQLLFDLPVLSHIRHYFNGSFILNSYGGTMNFPESTPGAASVYLKNIHRDIRIYTSHLRLMINVLVMIDDFTLDNGATWVLPGSHSCEARPSDNLFFQFGQRLTGTAGSIVCFDSNLWHAAGVNYTSEVRRGLTLTFTLPFYKQQMDYPRFLSQEYADKLTEEQRQLLGYDARIPTTYAEWYQPAETRLYKEVI